MASYLCDEEATQRCPRCGNAYCGEHGDDLCADCLSPVNAAPRGNFFRASLLALLLGSVLALWLLIRPPGLPGESSDIVVPEPSPPASPKPAPPGAPPAPGESAPKAESPPLIRDLPVSERPRERLRQWGASALSNAELLAIILRTGAAGENVVAQATRLLSRFHGLPRPARAPVGELWAGP